MKTHPYRPDFSTPPDYRNRRVCAQCGLPKTNRAHDVPDLADEQRAADARLIGEEA